MIHRVVIVVAYAVVSTVATQVSRADTAKAVEVPASIKARVEQLYLEGVTMYKAGQYRWAAAKFREAYVLYPDPKLLYNEGRCQEALGELQRAQGLYEQCASHEKTTPELKRKSQRRLRMLRAAQVASKTAAPPARATGKPHAAVAGARTPSRDQVAVTAKPIPSDSETNWLAVGKWTATGLSVALFATGAVFLSLGASDQDKVDDAIAAARGGVVSMTLVQAKSLQDDANRKKVVGYTMIGLGAAAVATSAALFVLDAGRERAEPRLRIGMGPGPGGGSVLLSGRF